MKKLIAISRLTAPILRMIFLLTCSCAFWPSKASARNEFFCSGYIQDLSSRGIHNSLSSYLKAQNFEGSYSRLVGFAVSTCGRIFFWDHQSQVDVIRHAEATSRISKTNPDLRFHFGGSIFLSATSANDKFVVTLFQINHAISGDYFLTQKPDVEEISFVISRLLSESQIQFDRSGKISIGWAGALSPDPGKIGVELSAVEFLSLPQSFSPRTYPLSP